MPDMPPWSDCSKALSLPPVFTAEPEASPWHAALAQAADRPPGTLFYAPVTGLLECALILTPDQPVDDATVRRLATLAVLDTLIALAPAKTTVSILPSGKIAVNDGEVATLAVQRGPALPDGIPSWLVLGVTVRLDLRLQAPGLTPWLTDLAEEGVETSGATVLESICRHLLAAIDLWQTEGAPGIAQAWRAAHSLQPA
jgi:biotin-(acetyl-CoA carboxylase) ligase